MLKIFNVLVYLLIGAITFLSFCLIPVGFIVMLFSDTKTAFEILIFLAAEAIILYAIIFGIKKLLDNKRTATVTRILLTVLFIVIAVKFVSNAPSGCVNTRYVTCD